MPPRAFSRSDSDEAEMPIVRACSRRPRPDCMRSRRIRCPTVVASRSSNARYLIPNNRLVRSCFANIHAPADRRNAARAPSSPMGHLPVQGRSRGATRGAITCASTQFVSWFPQRGRSDSSNHDVFDLLIRERSCTSAWRCLKSRRFSLNTSRGSGCAPGRAPRGTTPAASQLAEGT